MSYNKTIKSELDHHFATMAAKREEKELVKAYDDANKGRGAVFLTKEEANQRAMDFYKRHGIVIG